MPYTVALVKPAIWRDDLREWVTPLDEETRRLAVAILSGLHNRHIGITPRLAASLALALRAPSSRQYRDPWRGVHDRLRRALDELGGLSAQGEQRQALLLRTSFAYSVYHLTQPVIDVACRVVLEQTMLFTEDERIKSVTAQEYEQYDEALNAAIMRLLRDADKTLSPLFWRERALMLQALTKHNGLPDVDLTDAGIFTRLQPDVHFHYDDDHRLMPSQEHARVYDRRIKEAGVDGVRLTTRADELQHMLLTEYLYPETIRLDRLLNAGYWVFDQPPQPVRLRDVLVMGIMAGEVATQPSASLIKTCWFDYALTLSRVLRRDGIDRSEFRWIEGDAVQRVRTFNYFVDRMPAVAGSHNRAAYRQLFLSALGWLPAYLDRQSGYERLPDSYFAVDSGYDARDPAALMRAWLNAAWQTQTDAQRWQDEQTDAQTDETRHRYQPKTMQTGEFQYVHVMVFLPAHYNPALKETTAGLNPLDEDAPLAPHRLNSLFHLPNGSLSITYCPAVVNDATWDYAGSTRFSRHWYTENANPPVDTARLASSLIDVWLRSFAQGLTI